MRATSAYILKIVEKDPFLRLQVGTEEHFNRHQLFYFSALFLTIHICPCY